MIKNQNRYLIANYSEKPKNPKMTHIRGYMKDPANIRWDESITITQGVKKRDRLSRVILDLSDKKIIANNFNTGRSFDEILEYFMNNYTKQVVPVMVKIDPAYVAAVAQRMEDKMNNKPQIQEAEIVHEEVQAQ